MIDGALRLYRAVDVAEVLTLSVREVWRLVAEGMLPPPVKIGRCFVWVRLGH
jgi:predicted DNA-binding transcriptional regulator AlpA